MPWGCNGLAGAESAFDWFRASPRARAWRLTVAAGTDPETGKRRTVYKTVKAPDNRAGAKEADARLAELIVAVESGRLDSPESGTRRGLTVAQLAEMWQEANRPRQETKTGRWVGWSPKTARTVADNFRLHIFPAFGSTRAATVTGIQLDSFYRRLEEDKGLSASMVSRCHDQVRGMYNWAIRKKLADSNPALSADPPKIKRRRLDVPEMSQVRAVQEGASKDFASFIQLAATVGARRGTLVALRWGDVDFDRGGITFSRSIADSASGQIEKGTKSPRGLVIEPTTKPFVVEQAHST